ncbi:hypothetical protein [Mesorhizobium sp. 131-2-1]|uniref:hypothetical protein n=1 Tax=Mesorhizobium sp. 131-2-1 TaxID=2744518 RepID=UPI00192534E5|nr:hypothetical protein [Mesorhizobium sp. 131-2-1]BCG94368.1 hypothetical protein MesoLj131a_32320 [Mesorhizobium sp. 131-2-1]
MTEAEQEIARVAAETGASPASIRRLLVGAVNAAETDANKGLPLLMDEDEAHRLHGIAYTAALQAIGSARDQQLDELASKVFRLLAASVGRNNASYADRRESIRAVKD